MYQKEYSQRNPIKSLLKAAKSRANKRGLLFELQDSDIYLPDTCPILGIPLERHGGTGAGGKPNSYSLDRIIPEKGYVKDNVQVISHLANSMKSFATPEQLIKFAKWVLNTYD